MFFAWHLIHLHGLLFLCNLVRQNTLGLNSLAMAGLCKGVGKSETYDAIFHTNHVDRTSRHTCNLLIIPLHAFRRTDSCHFCCAHLDEEKTPQWISEQNSLSTYLCTFSSLPWRTYHVFCWQAIQLIAYLFFPFWFWIWSEDLRALEMFSCTSWPLSCLSIVQYHCLLTILRSH